MHDIYVKSMFVEYKITVQMYGGVEVSGAGQK